jgi:hypothetical protein
VVVTAMAALPERFLEITGEQWGAAHNSLFAEFGVPGTDHRASSRKGTLDVEDLELDDPVAEYLVDHCEVFGAERGKVFVPCPWKHEHSEPEAENETEAAWLVAGTNGYARGHFQCFHGSCRGRTDAEFLNAVGYRASTAEDFEDLTAELGEDAKRRFHLHTFAELKAQRPPTWFVKGVFPQGELGVLYGETGGGKTFFTLDMVAHIAAGRSWRGRKVKQASVAYVCAEGAGAFRNRTLALEQNFGEDLPLRVITDVPNFLQDDDVPLAAEINRSGGAELIVIDTLAQTTPGANENASEDMGRALSRCRRLAAETGAMVMLVHHAGKDLKRGARGWSGLKAAADFEIEISADGAHHTAKITKLKDGEGGQAFLFTLKRVLLGVDEDGDDVTSCVVEHVEGAPPSRPQVQGKWQIPIMACLEEELGGITPDALIARVLEMHPDDPPPGKRDRRRDKILLALKNLQNSGDVVDIGGMVAIP